MVKMMAEPSQLLEEVRQLKVCTERVEKRRQQYLSVAPHISAERTQLVTESWKKTDGEPLVIRRAKLFKKLMEEMPVVIRDGELIIGAVSKYIRGAFAWIEVQPDFILQTLSQERPTTNNEATTADITQEERDVLLECARYWEHRSVWYNVAREQQRILGDKILHMRKAVGVTGLLSNRLADFAGVINHGLDDVIARAKLAQSKLIFGTDAIADCEKHQFLEAVIICCEATITFARRHAEAAKKLAASEANPTRKRELEKIAAICEWVPQHPARTFQEALQSLWLTDVAAALEGGFTPQGRMDQYLYPLYEKDIKEGRLTRQEAAELFGCLWLKFNEFGDVKGLEAKKYAQASTFQQVTLAGVTRDGEDATNELSYLILEVARQMRTPQPGLIVRWHNRLSRDFLFKAVEVNRDLGCGIPCFISDEIPVRNFVKRGIPLEEARDWAGAGCIYPYLSHASSEAWYEGELNSAAVLELALYNGVHLTTGKQAGMATGDPTGFATFDQLLDAVKHQFDYVIDLHCQGLGIALAVRAQTLRTPFRSALLDDCIEKGLDWGQGGVRYPHMLTRVAIGRGLVNAADSLAAIKKLVYDEKKVTMSELLDALKANWEGYEKLRQMCLNAPKYGNDDDYVDDLMGGLSLYLQRRIAEHLNPWGAPTRATWQAGSGYYFFGMLTGATPDGRKAGEILADAPMSPMAGMDTKGPTAVFNSATKVDHLEHAEATMLNSRFSPLSLQKEESTLKFLALLKTFFDRGGYHVQVNVLNKEMLLDAKKHPERYRDLLVRVAGYSAYWVDLSPEVQDQIIARTEQQI